MPEVHEKFHDFRAQNAFFVHILHCIYNISCLFDLGRAGTRSPDPRNTPDQTPRAGAGAAASPAQSAVEEKFGK